MAKTEDANTYDREYIRELKAATEKQEQIAKTTQKAIKPAPQKKK